MTSPTLSPSPRFRARAGAGWLCAVVVLLLPWITPSTLAAAPGPASGQETASGSGDAHGESSWTQSSPPRAPGGYAYQIATGERPFATFIPLMGRGYLGLELTVLTPELRVHFGAPEDAGILVARVAPDSPADQAEIRVGDVITHLDGAEVVSFPQLLQRVRPREAGETVSIQLIRDGRRRTASVTVAEQERSAVDVGNFFHWHTDDEGQPHRLRMLQGLEGLEDIELDPEVFERLGKSLEAVDWQRVGQQIGRELEFGGQPDLEGRIEELEKRLEKLQAELERALAPRP